MKKRSLLMLLASLALSLSACGDDNPADGGGNGNTGTITVTVGAGVNPTYSWTVGDVFAVSVVRTSAPTTIVWNATTPGADGIASPVTHGTTPAGAISASTTETTLTAGVEYRVSVSRLDGSFGFTDFTP